MSWILIFLWKISVLLSVATCEQLKPGGKNVCSKTIEYDGYVVVQSSYVGYENYMTCCGLFCWSKCQKSRPVQKVYTKLVKRRLSRVEYSCCLGWGPVGGECLIPICNPPCKNGQCLSSNKCKCFPGFVGDRCEQDVDECKKIPPICDQQCENIPGSFVCSCKKGFKKFKQVPQNGKCININECEKSASLCACANPISKCKATCVDTEGDYECRCSKGFKLVQNNLCVAENECATGLNGCDHYCYNTNGKVSCGCKYGYILDSADKKTCKDINECSLSNGGCEQICRNFPGTFECSCRSGYKLLYDKRSCQDIDECASKKPCDPTRGICYNTRGSFRCSCTKGYQLQFGSVICEDKNECDLGSHGCSHECTNLIGSYECRCPNGYTLSPDKKTCLDINECKNGMHDCTQICVNEPGSYRCRCYDEYRLESDRKTCTPKPCNPLPRISNGEVNCLSQSVGSNCSYTCHTGYEINGDAVHQCLEKQIWSGKDTICRPISCPYAVPPLNGKLILPCAEHFNSRCIVRCSYGYYLQGNGFTECSIKNGRTFWKINNYCKALQLCTPNPCKHGGRCHVLSTQLYKCDCRGTGYVGSKCNVGVIEIPTFPTLEVREESATLTMYAKPEQELVITASVPNQAIDFIPQKIIFTSTKTTAAFKLRAKSQDGSVRVSFNMSGLNANDFVTPASALVRIVAGKYEALKRIVTEDFYVRQCNKKKISTCENGNEITLYSSCPFDSLDSTGHISVGNSKLQVPFSINGFTSKSGDSSLDDKEIFTPRSDIATAMRKGMGICKSQQCNEHLIEEEYAFSIKNNLFIRAYLKQISNIAPWWFNVFLKMTYKGFDTSSFQSLVFKGDIPKFLESCPNLPVLRNSTFSIYTGNILADINFMSSQFSMEKTSSSCIVTDLCNERFYLSIPIAKSIDASAVLASIGVSNTFLQISGIGMATSKSFDQRCVLMYGDDKDKKICVNGNIWSKFTLHKHKQMYNITFQGDAVFQIQNINKIGVTRFDEPYESIGDGELDLTIKIPLTRGKTIDLEVNDPQAKIYKIQTASKNASADGITILTTLKQVRFNYNSPMITFKKNKEDEMSRVEIIINYFMSGGSVASVADQSNIRIKLTLLLNNINALLAKLSRLHAGISLDVEKRVLLNVKNTLLSVTTSLRSPMMYEDLYKSLANVRIDAHRLKDYLESLHAKINSHIAKDVNKGILFQIKSMISIIVKFRFSPSPSLNNIEENLYASTLKLKSQICLYRLCFKYCLVKMSSKTTQSVDLQCLFNRDETLNRYLKVTSGNIAHINIDLITGEFTVQFKPKISLFDQVNDADIFVNSKTFRYTIKNFLLEDNMKIDLIGTSPVNFETTWDTLDFNLEGRFSQSSTTTKEINKIIEDHKVKVARQTTQQINALNEQLNSPRIKNMDLTKVIASKALKAAKLAEKVMNKNLKEAKVSLIRKRQLFKSYQVTSYLRDFEARLNKDVCSIKQCRKECTYINLCKICEKTENVKAKVLKCENIEKKVRLTSEEEYNAQCDELVKAYKSIYTGTCHGGGNDEKLKEALPNWGAGIGSTIGGPVGALIGGLSGGLIGQFFLGCEHTWSKYAVKEIVSRPCTKLRLKVKEQTWLQSVCNEYEESVLSTFQRPSECNCTKQCVETQDVSCVLDNKRCLDKRKVHLDNVLARAGVFNATATSFIEAEKNVTLWEKRYQKSLEHLTKQQNFYDRTQNSYNAILQYKLSIERQLMKLQKSDSFQSCIRAKHFQNFTINFNEIVFKRNFRTKVTQLILKAKEKELTLQVKLFEIMDHVTQQKEKILKYFLCNSNLGYNFLATTYISNNLNMDNLCNRTQKLYSFTLHPLESLIKLISHALEKTNLLKHEMEEISKKISAFSSGKNSLPDESKIEYLSLEKALDSLKKKIKEETPLQVILNWLQDMEQYSLQMSLYENFGFIDSIKRSFEEFITLGKYSGFDAQKYKNALISASNLYHYFFTNASSSNDLKSLQTSVKVAQMLLTTLKRNTKFCDQTLEAVVSFRGTLSRTISKKLGDQVTITCVAKSSSKVRYSWFKNQRKIPWEHKNTLLIKIDVNTGGSYRCRVEDLVKLNISQELTVKVFAPPRIIEQPIDTTIVASEKQKTISLFCNASGIPKPAFEWHFKSFNEKDLRFFSHGNLLKLSINDTLTSGFYYCKATNIHGSVLSKPAAFNIVQSCIAHQAYLLSFHMPREEVTLILEKIFYSENARKAWSVSNTQKITLSVVHQRKRLSKIIFKLKDFTVDDSIRCSLEEFEMVSHVSKAKSNIVKLLKNVLRTMSLKVHENSTIAEIRENSRSTLLLEPDEKEFCPHGFTLHESQIKCIECSAGTFENGGKCFDCPKGKFNEIPGSTICKTCKSMKTTLKSGASSRFMCQ